MIYINRTYNQAAGDTKISCFLKFKKNEAFNSFIKVEDSSAIGLHKLITNSIQQKGLDIKTAVDKDTMTLQ